MNNFKDLDYLLKFIQDLPIGIMCTDPSSQDPSYFNNFFLELFGWELEDIDTIEKWLEKAYPEKDYQQKVLKSWEESKKEAKSQNSGFLDPIVVKIACKDGTYKWCNVRYYEKGSVVYGIFSDITKQVEKEKLLERAQEISQLGFYTLDILNDNWTSSQELNSILGIDSDIKKSTETWLSVVHPDSRDELLRYFQENIVKNHEVFDKVYRVVNQKTQEIKWVHGKGDLVLDVDGRPVKLFGTIQDITLTRELTLTLENRVKEEIEKNKKAQKKLVQKSIISSQNMLLKNISHHWRNPLNIVSLGLDTISEELEATKCGNEIISKNIDNSKRSIKALSESLTQFNNFLSPNIYDTDEEFDLVELIWKLHDLVVSLKDSLRIHCACNLPKSPVLYKGNKKLISTVLTVLYLNAIESIHRYKQESEKDDEEHSIGFSIIEEEKSVAIEIKDSGDKFSEEVLEHLFQPYASEKKYTLGSGLSLYNANMLVSGIGGELEVANLPDRGSVVVCRLVL